MTDESPSSPPPSSRRGIFSTDASRANQILARTLYNELVSSGRDRSAIIDIVNALLDVLVRSQGKPAPALLVDPETGFPTRAGLLALLQHEVDPSGTDQRRVALALISAPGAPSTPVLAGILRARLRGADFVVPLGNGRAAAILYCDESNARSVAERLAKALGDHSALGAAPVTVHVEPLRRGDRVVGVWRRALVGLRAARAEVPPSRI
jgi:GGDEF domain-containing protein